MLYISDMSRIKEGLYGITDTADNVLEYIPFDDVAEAVKGGTVVYGFTDKLKFTATPFSDDEVIYLGDYIAPPLSAIVGAYYFLKGKDIEDKPTSDILYNLFYLYESKPCYSICRLYVPNDLLKKYEEKVREIDKARMPNDVSGYSTPRPISLGRSGYASISNSANKNVIELYFSCSLFVEVEVEVLTNVDKICSLCNISQNFFRLQVMNACNFCGDNRIGDITSLAIPTMSCNRYIDVAYPEQKRSISITRDGYNEELKVFNFSAYTHLTNDNSSELMNNYWNDFIDCAYGLLGYGSLCQLVNYNSSKFCVDLDRKYLFGLKADCYTLNAFGNSRYYRNASPYSAMGELRKVFPNKAQYIQDMIDRYMNGSKTDYLIYASIYGTYLVRDNILEYVRKGGNTQLDSVKTKLKLFSSNVRITDITNRILKLTLVLENGADEYVDLVGLSGTSSLGNIERLLIDFAYDDAIPKSIKITIPKGIKMVKFNGWDTYRFFEGNSTIEFETTSNTEIKGLLKSPEIFYFKNIIMNDAVKPYALKVMFTDIKYDTHYGDPVRQITNENHTRFLFDIMRSAKDMTDKQKQNVYKMVKDNLELFIENTCIRVSYSVSSNRTWNAVNISKVNHTDISNLSALGLVREGEELYYFEDGRLNHFYQNRNVVKSDFSQDAVRAFIGALSNVIVTYMEVDPFIEDIAKLYVKYLRLITLMTNYMINHNLDGLGYSIEQNKFTVYQYMRFSGATPKRIANDISFNW